MKMSMILLLNILSWGTAGCAKENPKPTVTPTPAPENWDGEADYLGSDLGLKNLAR